MMAQAICAPGFLQCEARDDGSGIKLPPLYCPRGHRIQWEHAFHEAGFPRCTRLDAEENPCNERLFVVFFPRLNTEAKPLMFVAPITYEQIMHITKTGMDVPAIMFYIGVAWKPVGP